MLKEFLVNSSIAKKVKLPSTVTLFETKLNTKELLKIKKEGQFTKHINFNKSFVLNVNKIPIAEGKIIKRRNSYFFKVIKLIGDQE